MKLRILICDDKAEHRKWVKSALIRLISHVGQIQKRIELADDLFEIHTFSIVGNAIKALRSGLKPDIAVIDLNYTHLKEKQVKDFKLNPTEEITSIRGFDLLQEIKDLQLNSVCIIFTGHAANDLDIDQELESRNLEYKKDWYAKGSDKGGGGGKIFEMNMHYLLKKATQNILSKLSNTERNDLTTEVLKYNSEEHLLNMELELDNRSFRVKNFLLGWSNAILDSENNIKIIYDKPLDILLQLLEPQRKRKFSPAGIWKEQYMLEAIQSYQSNKSNYIKWKDDIDEKSAILTLEVIEQALNTQNLRNITTKVRVSSYNCASIKDLNQFDNQDIDARDKFREKFFNSLILRRLCIGLSSIRHNRRTKFVSNQCIDLVALVVRRRVTPPNVKIFFNNILGLKGETNIAIQAVNTSIPYILEEEYDWTQKYVPIIEDKVNSLDFEF